MNTVSCSELQLCDYLTSPVTKAQETTGIDPHKQRRRNSGRAVKELTAMEACKIQTNRYQLCLFLRSNNVGLKIIARITENHSDFLGARMAAINLFQVDLYKPENDV